MILPRLASAEPLTQLGGLAVTQGARWQHGQALGPSSSGGSKLSYPLGATKISFTIVICYMYVYVVWWSISAVLTPVTDRFDPIPSIITKSGHSPL